MVGAYKGEPAGTQRTKRPDFSAGAISRAVVARTAQKPYVLYPLAVGLLGGLAVAVLGPSTLFVVPAVLGAVIGLGGWALDATLRRERHAGDYLRQLQRLLAGQVDAGIQTLERDLAEVGSTQGLNQLDRLRGKYTAFEQLLRRKLNPDELTYSRYLGITEQVFLAGLDNLKRVADTSKGMSAIDENHVLGRIEQLRTLAQPSVMEAREIEALETRLALFHRQAERTQDWLSQNEAAMTQIDQIMAAIVEMDTSEPHATMDMESAMQELRRLAERAQSYSRGAGA